MIDRVPPWVAAQSAHRSRSADADPMAGSLRCDLCRERPATRRVVPSQRLERRTIWLACAGCGANLPTEPLRVAP